MRAYSFTLIVAFGLAVASPSFADSSAFDPENFLDRFESETMALIAADLAALAGKPKAQEPDASEIAKILLSSIDDELSADAHRDGWLPYPSDEMTGSIEAAAIKEVPEGGRAEQFEVVEEGPAQDGSELAMALVEPGTPDSTAADASGLEPALTGPADPAETSWP